MRLDRLLSNAQVVNELARTTGVGAADARTGLEALLPALARGLAPNATSPQVLEGLLGTLGAASHERYLDSPELLASGEARRSGEQVLEQIFGSQDVCAKIVALGSSESGLAVSLLQKLFPVVAVLAAGTLRRRSASDGFEGVVLLLADRFGVGD